MGLTNDSTGSAIVKNNVKKNTNNCDEKVIALAGNPNVGKSTVFNHLTGLNQHTGNWPGKTVTNARGYYQHREQKFIIVDLPGTYSLMSNSTEEEIARDFICFGNPQAIVIVIDATCLERNLNLVLQAMEISDNIIVCANLMDEANKKKIHIDLEKLENILGIPVVGTSARNGRGLDHLMDTVYNSINKKFKSTPLKIQYNNNIEEAIDILEPAINNAIENKLKSRWVALKLLDQDTTLLSSLNNNLKYDLLNNSEIKENLGKAQNLLREKGLESDKLRDFIVSSLINEAEKIAHKVVRVENYQYNKNDRTLDRILTSKKWGIPIMLILLAFVFWLTITGANYPSQLISVALFWLEDRLLDLFIWLGAPSFLQGLLIKGVYRTVAWVVSVMLPPMAIFFPLFTLLEDSGYLPRIAFNLDNFFKKACAHGKQSLTMCMGFGCNAAGIIGCRIIDSPRERLIAIITNNFVPCNGRFPTLIAIISMFFAGMPSTTLSSIFSTLILTGVIIFGILMTLFISKILSMTILKGIPSSFTLELPPYRRPKIGSVIVRSLYDRTLFVLGRAIKVAAPAGLIIWLLANINLGDTSLLTQAGAFLDPFARLLGLDGFILLAFILGFPANEIVVPIIIMSYMTTGNIMELDSLSQLHSLLISHGWTWLTALCMMLFALMHWPCGTTCLTIKKETQSLKWTIVSFIVPTICGISICFIIANSVRLLGLI